MWTQADTESLQLLSKLQELRAHPKLAKAFSRPGCRHRGNLRKKEERTRSKFNSRGGLGAFFQTFRVYDLGFQVYDLGFHVYDLGLHVYDLGLQVYGLGCSSICFGTFFDQVYVLGFQVYDLGLQVYNLGLQVYDLGCKNIGVYVCF